MKEVTAKLRNLQISPRKVRLVTGLISSVPVAEAKKQLSFSSKKAAHAILKLLNSAIANAENNFKMNPDSLLVKEVLVGQGRVLKRWQPRAFGRAGMLRKRASHITIILEGREAEAKPIKEKSKAIKSKSVKADKSKKTQPAHSTSRQSSRQVSSGPSADQEKAEPVKKESIPATEDHKSILPDPRMQGHERKNQHIDKTQKEKPSVQRTHITRTQNK